jgi:hypothetical protein
MAVTSAAEIYEGHIRALPIDQRLELLAMIAAELAAERGPTSDTPRHSLVELHGLGKDLWAGVDAQEYVNRLRDEWHDPPP